MYKGCYCILFPKKAFFIRQKSKILRLKKMNWKKNSIWVQKGPKDLLRDGVITGISPEKVWPISF